ncbi:hypothetical protein KSP40_PGU017004 [Platanthera guangdongensis]|uniref:Uncharacterized protein n=1 Tax=Platanthera guangdongensis TaxID=2320717 RepID=A0ABR2LH86_9ASPA
MKLSSMKTLDRKMLFASSPSIPASNPMKISSYKEEMIVVHCFYRFCHVQSEEFWSHSQSHSQQKKKVYLEELHQFSNPNQLVPLESNEQQRLLRLACEFSVTCTYSWHILLHDNMVTDSQFSARERFAPGCTLKASIVELREGLVVLSSGGNFIC